MPARRRNRCGPARCLVAASLVASGAAVVGASEPAVAAPGIGAVAVAPPVAGAPTRVTATVGGVTTEAVVLDVIVGFAEPTVLPMRDDGVAPDASAADGTFTTEIPAQGAGTLVRHRVRAGSGATEAVFPAKDGKRRYDGFVVARPAVATQLPLLDWYLSSADATWLANNRTSKEYVPAVLVVGGRVIDGAEVRNQGGFTASFSPKPNVKFKLPGQQVLQAPFFDLPVDEFVADADYEDPTSALGVAAWKLFGEAGVPVRQATTARVERNGSFYGVYQLYQESDGTWLDQLPYPIASFYEGESSKAKLVDEGDSALLAGRWAQAEGDGSTEDIEDLVRAVDRSGGPQRIDAIADRFDLPRLIDLLAMSALVQHTDAGSTNLDLARGTDGRWRVLPNDLDLTLGLRGRTRERHLLPIPLAPTLAVLRTDGDLSQQVARRIRTIYERSFADDQILDDVRTRVEAMQPDLALDRAKWPIPGVATPQAGLEDLADFLATQRQVVTSWTAEGLLPTTTEGDVRIAEIAAAGAATDFVELANPDPTRSVDLSGWTLAGAASATLPGGTVLAPGARLVVPRAPATVAARGQGIQVSGQLGSVLPGGGGTLELRTPGGTVRDAITWSIGAGWPAPGASGRTIEATALDGSRSSGAGWRLSPQPGGTPGDAGASATGLTVRTSAPGPFVYGDDGAALRIEVGNAGPGGRTGVVLDGPSADCDRALRDLAAGQAHVVTCRGPGRSAPSADSLRSVVRSVEQPQGAVDAPMTVRLALDQAPAAPALDQVRLGSGTLEVGYDAGPYDADASSSGLWRVEGRFVPEGAGTTVGSVLERTSPSPMAATVDRPGRVVAVARTSGGLTNPSSASPVVTPRATDVWPFSSAGALVDRWYRDLAGRAPTPSERALWVQSFAGPGAPSDLATFLLGTDRWLQQVDPLVRLYLAHFGRLPDPTGFDYWVAKRRAGTTLARINAQFAGSTEFARRYGGRPTREVVAAVYQNVFGRAPDASGLDYWTRKVERGTSVATVVLAFSESSEGLRRKAPTVAGIVTWYALHGGQPSTRWLSDATAWLEAGGDRATLVESARSPDAYRSVVD